MFWIVCDPSSGSIELYLTEIRTNYAAKHRPSTWQTPVYHYEFQSSTALYSLMMDRIQSETCWS